MVSNRPIAHAIPANRRRIETDVLGDGIAGWADKRYGTPPTGRDRISRPGSGHPTLLSFHEALQYQDPVAGWHHSLGPESLRAVLSLDAVDAQIAPTVLTEQRGVDG
jgi:hypothetical protein